ncbi:MAG TPA: hypothetical protein VIK40_00640 [Geomonas sp.]
MVRYLIYLSALVISLGGCASYPDVNRDRLESLPQHYIQFDMILSWQVRSAGAQTVVDGVLKNVRWTFMDDVEVWVAALDASGKPTARSVSFIIPNELRRDEVAPFTVKLPVGVVPGTRLRFTYKYTGSDGGNDGPSATSWMQSFEAEVPKR